MNEEAALWAALVANPGDETLRLVYADWLQDHDDPRAAWFRGRGVWPCSRWELPAVLDLVKPGPRGPVERLVQLVADEVYVGAFDGLVEPFGREFVTRLRAWGAEAPLERGQRMCQQLKYLQKYAPVPLEPVETLIGRLSSDDWYEQWLALIDLGQHGPAAARAVPKLIEWDHRPRIWNTRELDWEPDPDNPHPYDAALHHTFGRIGPAAVAAAPILAAACWNSRVAVDALYELRPDPLVVLEHINDDDDDDTRHGLFIVQNLDPSRTDALVHAVRHESGRKRSGAIRILADMGREAAHVLPALTETFNSLGYGRDEQDDRRELRDAIERIERAIRFAPPS